VTRQFTFKGFPDAIAFVTRLAFDAEAADHHQVGRDREGVWRLKSGTGDRPEAQVESHLEPPLGHGPGAVGLTRCVSRRPIPLVKSRR
jgi:hypothetical protein